jgi:hypothetical protein
MTTHTPSDGTVRLMDARHPAAAYRSFGGGEQRAVRCASVDAAGRHLAVGCTDGYLLVWRVAEPARAPHAARILPASASSSALPASVAFRTAFEPTGGRLLAVPGEAGCQLLDCHDAGFRVLRTLSASSSSSSSTPSPTVACAWSPNGAYLACATLAGAVHIFHTQPLLAAIAQAPHGGSASAAIAAAVCPSVAVYRCDDAVGGLAWAPAADCNALAIIDNGGKLYFWRSAVPLRDGLPSPTAPVDFAVKVAGSGEDGAAVTASASKGGRLKKLSGSAAARRRDDEDDDEDGVDDDMGGGDATEAEEAAAAAAAAAASDSSSAAAVDDKAARRKSRRDKEAEEFDPEAMTADDLDVINGGAAAQMGLGGDDGSGGGVFDESPESLRKSMLKAVRDAMRDEFAPAMQASFQPGATAVPASAAAHTGTGRRAPPQQRFLAWNSVGAILCREDDSTSHVEIEFADANRKPVRFQQPFAFSLGALGQHGALLASLPDGEVPPTLWFQVCGQTEIDECQS